MTKVISFFSQKGGVGKTSFTAYIASALQHSGNKVLVLDADFSQHSLVNERSSEMMRVKNNPELQWKLDSSEDKPFDLRPTQVKDVLTYLPALVASNEFNYIFIDLPGTLNLPGLSELVQYFDSVIIPMEVGLKVFSSGIETVKYFTQLKPQLPLYILWNRINASENSGMRIETNKVFVKKGNVHILDTLIHARVGFQRETVTLFAPLNDQILKLWKELIDKNIL